MQRVERAGSFNFNPPKRLLVNFDHSAICSRYKQVEDVELSWREVQAAAEEIKNKDIVGRGMIIYRNEYSNASCPLVRTMR